MGSSASAGVNDSKKSSDGICNLETSKPIKDDVSRHKQEKKKKLIKTTQVEPIHLVQDGSDSSDNEDDPQPRNQHSTKDAELEEKLLKMEKLAGELEKSNLDLMEQVQSLEQQNYILQNEQLMCNKKELEETAIACDQHVIKLESDLKKALEQLKKTRATYKAKCRKLETQLIECKQEMSMKSFEHAQQIDKLVEEKLDLQSKLRGSQPSAENAASSGGDADQPLEQGSHYGLVVQLSAKISEQDAYIKRLENTVDVKNKQIEEFLKPEERVSKSANCSSSSRNLRPDRNIGASKEAVVSKSSTTAWESLMSSMNIEDESNSLYLGLFKDAEDRKFMLGDENSRIDSCTSRDSGVVIIKGGDEDEIGDGEKIRPNKTVELLNQKSTFSSTESTFSPNSSCGGDRENKRIHCKKPPIYQKKIKATIEDSISIK